MCGWRSSRGRLKDRFGRIGRRALESEPRSPRLRPIEPLLPGRHAGRVRNLELAYLGRIAFHLRRLVGG
jgi:hypothetical protein